jgi:hypothetical protein
VEPIDDPSRLQIRQEAAGKRRDRIYYRIWQADLAAVILAAPADPAFTAMINPQRDIDTVALLDRARWISRFAARNMRRLYVVNGGVHP